MRQRLKNSPMAVQCGAVKKAAVRRLLKNTLALSYRQSQEKIRMQKAKQLARLELHNICLYMYTWPFILKFSTARLQMF